MLFSSTRWAALSTLLLAILGVSSTLYAAQAVGTVIGAQGTVTARDANGDRPLEMTSDVFVRDLIITGPDSKVQILFTDDTILAQGPDSESSLEDYAYLDGEEEDSRFLLDMAEGTFRVISGRIVEDNPDEGFRMQTPLAVIGIRGTMTGHVVHNGQEHHYSLDLHGNHTVNVSARFDGAMGILDGDFQALDITSGMPLGNVREMTQEEQDFMSDATGITSYNPTPGALLVRKPSAIVATISAGGAVVYADGTILNPDGSIVNPDGTILNPDGAVVNADGSILYADGTVLNPDGSIVRPDGSILTPDGYTFLADGTILDGDGNVIIGDVGLAGSDTGTDVVETIQSSTTGTATTTTTFSPNQRTAQGLLVQKLSPATFDGVQPYTLPVSTYKNDVWLAGNPGLSDELKIDEAASSIWYLVADGNSMSPSSIDLTFTILGEKSDAQWGYWEDTLGVAFNAGSNEYEIIKIYDVRVDVPTTVRPDLAGTYTGQAAGVLSYYGTIYYSSSGSFVCNVTDITSGTIQLVNMTVNFTPGAFAVDGVGNMTNGKFTIGTADLSSINVIDVGAGQAEITGAVGTDGTMAGTFNFSEGTDRYGVGYFEGSQ